jgi:hypothetical protein
VPRGLVPLDGGDQFKGGRYDKGVTKPASKRVHYQKHSPTGVRLRRISACSDECYGYSAAQDSSDQREAGQARGCRRVQTDAQSGSSAASQRAGGKFRWTCPCSGADTDSIRTCGSAAESSRRICRGNAWRQPNRGIASWRVDCGSFSSGLFDSR